MILARHAEALFWAGRQLERAETTTRALDVIGRNAMHHRPERARSEWRSLLELFGVSALFDASHGGDAAGQGAVAEFLFADPGNPGSVVASAGQLRENIRTVRDRVPVELWEEANRLHLQLHASDALSPLQDAPFELFSSVRRGCQAMAGVAAEAMARDEGYTFVDIGRMIERSTVTCRLIRFGLFGNSPDFDASTVLRMASSLQAYRRSEGYEDDPQTLAAFLLSAERVPRSVLACLRRVDDRLAVLGALGPAISPAQQVCGRVRSTLEYGGVAAGLDTGGAEYVAQVENGVVGLGQIIANHAFNPAHSPVQHAQFVRPGADQS